MPPYDLQDLNRRGGLYITRPAINWYLQNSEERTWRYTELFHHISQGTLALHVGQAYTLADAKPGP